jgi:AraC-like DNA-binding protein
MLDHEAISLNDKGAPPALTCCGLTPAHSHRCIRYIHSNLDKKLTLEAVAKVCGYSAWHFARLFRQTTGLTLRRYVTEVRLGEARQLLSTSEIAIAEVAQRCGFVDQSHLSRLFRKYVGKTPARFRAMAAANSQQSGDFSARLSNRASSPDATV